MTVSEKIKYNVDKQTPNSSDLLSGNVFKYRFLTDGDI